VRIGSATVLLIAGHLSTGHAHIHRNTQTQRPANQTQRHTYIWATKRQHFRAVKSDGKCKKFPQ